MLIPHYDGVVDNFKNVAIESEYSYRKKPKYLNLILKVRILVIQAESTWRKVKILRSRFYCWYF